MDNIYNIWMKTKKHTGRIAVEGKSQFQSYLWIGTKFIHDSENVRRTSTGTSRNHEDERAVTSMIFTGIFSPPDVCCVSPSRTFHTNVVK